MYRCAATRTSTTLQTDYGGFLQNAHATYKACTWRDHGFKISELNKLATEIKLPDGRSLSIPDRLKLAKEYVENDLCIGMLGGNGTEKGYSKVKRFYKEDGVDTCKFIRDTGVYAGIRIIKGQDHNT